MKIAIIGSGHVGLVTGACFADLGNDVVCIDNDKHKVDALIKFSKGLSDKLPIYEPGLEELIRTNANQNKIHFTTSIEEGIKDREIIFICVGTPPKANGQPDLSHVEEVVKQIASVDNSYRLIVEKSTVPVNTANWLNNLVKKYFPNNKDIDIAVNPEFLREGSAIKDTMEPERIVIGVNSNKAKNLLLELYEPLRKPIIFTNVNSAELIKHASNAFLATKISFANLIADLCEETGADADEVLTSVGMDKRIGELFLKPSPGYGGYCFPKDLDAFIHVIKKAGLSSTIFEGVQNFNNYQKARFVVKVEKVLGELNGKALGVLGLSFKPNTDDIRLSSAIDIINNLIERGATIKAYDPKAMDNAKKILDIEYCDNVYKAAEGCDALLILTEWKEFEYLDLLKIKKLLKNPIIIDGRNMYSVKKMKNLGFTYISIGR